MLTLDLFLQNEKGRSRPRKSPLLWPRLLELLYLNPRIFSFLLLSFFTS